MNATTPASLRRRGTDELALAFYVVSAAILAIAALSVFARYFMGQQIPLIADVVTSSQPQLAVADGEYATYRTVEFTVHDPSLWSSVLLSLALITRYFALALTCVLVGWLTRRLGTEADIFTAAAARALTVLGVVLMSQPVLTHLLGTLGTRSAIADADAAAIPLEVGDADYILAPDLWWGILHWEVLAGVVFGAGLIIIGQYLRRARAMAKDLQGLV